MVSDDALLRGGMFSALPVEPERAVEPIVESVVSAPLISARTGLRLRRPGAPQWSEMFSGEVYSAPLDGAGGPEDEDWSNIEYGSDEEWAEVEDIAKTLELDPPWYKEAARYLTGGEAEQDVERFFTEFPGRVAEGAGIVGTGLQQFAASEQEKTAERDRVLREEGIGSYIDQFVTSPTKEASQNLKRIATGGMTMGEAQVALAAASLDPTPLSYLADLTSAGLYLYEDEPGYAALAASPVGLIGGAGAMSAHMAVKAEKLAKAAKAAESIGDSVGAAKLLSEASPLSIAGARGAEQSVDAATLWRERGVYSPYFRRWFGSSKVVDEAGKPIILYHGTVRDFDTFRAGKINHYGDGIYFTDLPEYAGEYARSRKFMADLEPLEGGNIIPAYVSMKNPLTINKEAWERGNGPVFAEIEGIVQRNMADPDYLKSLSPDKRAVIDEYMTTVDKRELWTGFPRGRPVRGRNDPELPMLAGNPYRGFAITDYAKSRGHDGVIIKNAGVYDDYTKYDAHQAKLKKGLADLDAAWQKRLKDEPGPVHQRELDELKKMKQEMRDDSFDLAEEMDYHFPERKPFVEYLVFEPTQIKSVYNKGTFSPTDPRFRYGLGPVFGAGLLREYARPSGLDGEGGPAPQYERMPTEAEFMEGFEPSVEPAPEPEPIKPAYRNPPSTLQEWQRLNPGMVTKRSPQAEDEWERAEGEGRSALEDWKAAQKLREESDSPDELIGFDKDGIPIWKRVQTGGDVQPPRGHPPSGDGAVDNAMDIYRGSADNYPHDAPLDEQQGFAVAASTQDYNKGGWANEAPVAAQIVEYDGRRGEVREYAEGNRFFVSFADDVILRMHDKK